MREDYNFKIFEKKDTFIELPEGIRVNENRKLLVSNDDARKELEKRYGFPDKLDFNKKDQPVNWESKMEITKILVLLEDEQFIINNSETTIDVDLLKDSEIQEKLNSGEIKVVFNYKNKTITKKFKINFGNTKYIPYIIYSEEDELDINTFSKIIEKMKNNSKKDILEKFLKYYEKKIFEEIKKNYCKKDFILNMYDVNLSYDYYELDKITDNNYLQKKDNGNIFEIEEIIDYIKNNINQDTINDFKKHNEKYSSDIEENFKKMKGDYLKQKLEELNIRHKEITSQSKSTDRYIEVDYNGNEILYDTKSGFIVYTLISRSAYSYISGASKVLIIGEGIYEQQIMLKGIIEETKTHYHYDRVTTGPMGHYGKSKKETVIINKNIEDYTDQIESFKNKLSSFPPLEDYNM